MGAEPEPAVHHPTKSPKFLMTPRPEPIISVSGLRGILGESLTPSCVVRYAGAFAAEAAAGAILLARDGRATGPLIVDLLRGALVAAGREVLDVGPVSTPTAGVLVRTLEAAGAIQISASHNPPEYNGLKLFGADGRVVPAAFGERVLQRYRADDFPLAPHAAIGQARVWDGDPTAAHWELIARVVDVEKIQSKHYRVLLDSNCGAGGLLGRRVLEELGCTATVLGEEPTGEFLHTPEPTAENLQGVCRQVAEGGFDVGFCQDPDADRLAIIDADGRYIGEEYTPAICVKHVLASHPGPVVTNCSTSRMSCDAAEAVGAPFFLSAVGEANVADEMIVRGAVIGGEGNGGVIDPRIGYVRDSFVGMALVLEAMAGGASVAELASRLPRYAIVKQKIAATRAQADAAFDAIERRFPEATASRLDGLRLDWPDRWLLVRASNTEPIVRAIAEAKGAAAAESLCTAAAEEIGRVAKS